VPRRLVVIANPAAGRGTGARALAALAPALARHGVPPGDIRCTSASGDEATLTARAVDDGADVIAALGGDGTVSRVGATLAEQRADAALLVLPAGTGNDFAKSLDTPHDAAQRLALAADGARRRIDVGAIDGAPFLNAAGFGFDADVVRATLGARWLRGTALYAGTALRRLVGYPGLMAALDGAPRARRVLVAFANGHTFGGAFRIAPAARLDDGLLDAVLVDDAPPLGRVALLARVVRGTHGTSPAVTMRRAATFTLALDAPAICQADGELRTITRDQVTITTWPRALVVVARD
jgi:diacylglycerol kinase (ATP)